MEARGNRILVVDDNPATLYATGRVLRAAGFDVVLATTGTEAVSVASEAGPDLIVLDVNLPDFDGFEVVRRVRAVPRLAAVPILHLSATFVQDKDKVQGLEGGANGYLTHPVEPPVLVASIKAFLRTKQAEDALRRSEDRFRAIFDRALDGIALLSEDLIFVDVNPAMCRMLGRSRAEIVDRHLSAISAHGHDNEIGHVAAVVTREGGWRGEIPLLNSDGRRVELEWSLSRHSDPDIRLAIVTDVTERRASESERELLLKRESFARGEAERANRLKDDFLATLSHELRSPLNAIVGWTQVLQRRMSGGGVRNEELGDGLSVIERNARLQTQLISDLLDVSRIISGKMRIEIAPLDPAGPLEAALDGIRPAAEARQIRLETQIDRLAGPVLGDPARLQQVFWNLLQNAVKFTPHGGTVWARLVREGAQVTASVRDTGCGIDPEFLPYVFERFRQEQTSTQRSHGGLGLGLPIVRHLVEMHGGTVVAASEGKGRGATITVHLPLSDVRNQFRAPRREDVSRSVPEADLHGVRVLVVDDDDDARDLVARVLADRGAEVHEARSAAEALELAAEEAPRVLISDIGMPVEDGYWLIGRLRERGHASPGMHAIAVTALARAEDERKSMAAGYDSFFVKPVDLDALVERVSSVVRERAAGSSVAPR